MRTIKLTRDKYRALARIAKEEAGCGLAVSSFKKMNGAWGRFNLWAQLIVKDASSLDSRFDERGVIEIAESVNAEVLRSAVRPEIDWSVLRDDEIYPFVLWHEIGHRLNNFFMLEQIPDELLANGGRDKWMAAMMRSNEILADRYAWAKVRLGEPLPIHPQSAQHQERFNAELETLAKHFRIGLRGAHRPLPSGQYESIPADMLKSKRVAAWVGPNALILNGYTLQEA